MSGAVRTGLGVVCSLLLVALPARLCAAPPAADQTAARAKARGAFVHDGFYLGGELGASVLWLDSEASLSNGFRQSIPSSASAIMAPTMGGAIGGTLREIGLVLGGRLRYAEAREPAIETLGESFTVKGFTVTFFEFAGFANYYPDPRRGLHFGLGVGGAVLSTGVSDALLRHVDSLGGDSQRGLTFAVEAGQSAWIQRQLSLGAVFRLTAASFDGDFGETFLLMPTLSASFLWH